jgi:hypothetical protein
MRPARRLQWESLCFAEESVRNREKDLGGRLTWHNDLARTGQNRDETVLTPTNLRLLTSDPVRRVREGDGLSLAPATRYRPDR